MNSSDTYTMKSLDSSKPFAHILEGVNMSIVTNAYDYVSEYAKNQINATNYSDTPDGEILQAWFEGSEFREAVAYVEEQMDAFEQLRTIDSETTWDDGLA